MQFVTTRRVLEYLSETRRSLTVIEHKENAKQEPLRKNPEPASINVFFSGKDWTDAANLKLTF